MKIEVGRQNEAAVGRGVEEDSHMNLETGIVELEEVVRKNMIMRTIQCIEEKTEIEDNHMIPEKEEEGATRMMIEDIGKGQIQEIGEAIMAPVDQGGEGSAGRVSSSRGLLLQAPLLPRDLSCKTVFNVL